jgi:hypothetical protein
MDLSEEVDRLVEAVGRYQRRHGTGRFRTGLGRLLAVRWTELGPVAPGPSRPANLPAPAGRTDGKPRRSDRTVAR